MLLLGRCVLLSALAWGQQHPPRSGPKARRSKGRRDGARRLEDTAAPTKVPTSVPTSAPSIEPTFSPKPSPVPTSMPTAVPTPVPACCVEHQFTETGEVEGTTCYGGRSPWDAATMTDLCTAGYSEYGAAAPPFRDCRQEAIDSGNCGDTSCEGCWDHDYWANVGYSMCPDWVVDAINAEGAAGGQCADWVRDGYSYPSGSCGHHAWGADRDGYSKCASVGREPYAEGDTWLHVMGDDAETCCRPVDDGCMSWLSAHERCHDAHATGDDVSCCVGSDIRATCQCASDYEWWDARRLSAVDKPRRLGHCCDYDAYCSCMESELGAGCTAPDCGGDWDEDDEECAIEPSGDRSSSPSGTTNHGAGNGWCYSDLDEHVGCAASPGDCWAMCLGYYGDDLAAIDWGDGGDCYCQRDCECMEDVGDGETYLITRDSRVGALPHECGPDEGDGDGDEDWMWENGCRPDYCTSSGNDCYASMDWGEPATCSNGYFPSPPNPPEHDPEYTCCPSATSYPAGSCGDHAWGADRDGYSKCAWLGREPYPEGDAALHAMGDDAETCCPSADSCFVLVAFEPDPATQAMLGLPDGEFSVGLNDADRSYIIEETTPNVHSNTFVMAQTTEGTKMLHRSTDGSIIFPDMPDEWTTDATRPPSIDEDFLINVGLHVNCDDYAPGAKAIALGNYHESVGSWVVNEDGTISPFDAPHLILGWGDFTTASGSCGADNMNMDPQPNNLVLMDSAMALACPPGDVCAPVFRARGVDCDHAGHDHGSACDGIHLEAGVGEVCNWAHGETHGCPVVNTQLWDSELWSCDDLCGRAGGWCERAAHMSNNHCGSDVHEEYELACDQGIRDIRTWGGEPSHTLCWCRTDDTDHWWHYYDEDDDDDDDDGLGGGSELVMSGGLVAIGLTFTGITIATIANLMQEQCALGPTIIFEAGTTHPYYISPNLCTIGTHTYASKKTVRDASPRKVCRKFCEAASAAGKLALKHVQGLTCYCKRQ